jgi:hypothetical protein
MAIQGLEGLSDAQIDAEIANGGKFVVYSYCISILVMTFKRPSDIFFLRAGESGVGKGMPYTLISLFAGWWGFPFGLIYTPMAIAQNLGGGKDVTQVLLASMKRPMPVRAAAGAGGGSMQPPNTGAPLNPR